GARRRGSRDDAEACQANGAQAADQGEGQRFGPHQGTEEVKAYFDSSALLKLFVAEEGSVSAIRAWESARSAVTNRISYVETRAALASARRSRRLSPQGLLTAKQRLEGFMDEMQIIETPAALVR